MPTSGRTYRYSGNHESHLHLASCLTYGCSDLGWIEFLGLSERDWFSLNRSIRCHGRSSRCAVRDRRARSPETGGHGRAVDLHQISISARAEFVERACDDFLACASFSADQHGRVGSRYGLHLVEDGAQTAAPADNRPHERNLLAVAGAKPDTAERVARYISLLRRRDQQD
jgi:hypothetical protein